MFNFICQSYFNRDIKNKFKSKRGPREVSNICTNYLCFPSARVQTQIYWGHFKGKTKTTALGIQGVETWKKEQMGYYFPFLLSRGHVAVKGTCKSPGDRDLLIVLANSKHGRMFWWCCYCPENFIEFLLLCGLVSGTLKIILPFPRGCTV